MKWILWAVIALLLVGAAAMAVVMNRPRGAADAEYPPLGPDGVAILWSYKELTGPIRARLASVVDSGYIGVVVLPSSWRPGDRGVPVLMTWAAVPDSLLEWRLGLTDD